jgi:ABC-type multidrug transport system fused ATPase/permease subunit
VQIGVLLGAISEAIVGAETIRVYGATSHIGARIDERIRGAKRAAIWAQNVGSAVFSVGTLVANGVLAVVVVFGTWLGVGGHLTPGQLLAFVFVTQLFTGPVQLATEILNELQNAVAGWRRVLAVIDTPVDVPDTGRIVSPRGPAAVRLEHVSFAYPDGPRVLHDITADLPARASVAVVGATGSGKTTIAKLVTRLMDPTAGRVLLDGADLRDLTAASLRARVVLVPQEGFLFEGTLADNVAYGLRGSPVSSLLPDGASAATPQASSVAGSVAGSVALPEGAAPDSSIDGQVRARIETAVDAVGLGDWVAGLPAGLDTPVGQRGEGLSAGERQLVAILRAYLADADLLVLDEATSAVDPATEVRIARALDSLTAGRSTLTIAHRLSTAQAADLVVVVDTGRIVETGRHADLVDAGGVYSRMFAAWVAQTR